MCKVKIMLCSLLTQDVTMSEACEAGDDANKRERAL